MKSPDSTRIEFSISGNEVNGPLELAETVLSAQTSEPEWCRDGDSFMDIEILEGMPVKYSVTQSGGPDQFVLKVRVLCSRSEIQDRICSDVKKHLSRVLGLTDDLLSFYKQFSDKVEPLSETFSKLRGLRLMRGTNLYESLICSILSQNNSARLWNRSAQLLMKHYGTKGDLPDGSTCALFPRPGTVAKLTARQLQRSTSMGYRAKSVVEVSRLIAAGDLCLPDLSECSYERAAERLIELPGVGPKVADCFLLYGLGRLEAAPVDVWIHRIVTERYFRGRKVSRLQSARFLRERFRGWAGYAQLYLFDYARRTGAGPGGNQSKRRID